MHGVKNLQTVLQEVYNNVVTFIPRDGTLAQLLLQCLEIWMTPANLSHCSTDACLLPFALLT
jgi:hypothetical protein